MSPAPAITEVQTSKGRLRGSQVGGLSVFRGIPFAQPTSGARRFAAPVPVAPWEGTRDALEFGHAAPQPNPPVTSIFAGAFSAGDLEVGEDCLHLNIWTPGLDDAARPVMVWIHGGGFRTGTGSSPMYDGTAIATRGDVVVVTINYRLGPLGFLYADELGDSNFGIQDQVAALRWVQEEIRAFGGNPDNVTIFGESAGGKSVETLMATPAARGLFHRAIAQSTYDPPMSTKHARFSTQEYLGYLGMDAVDVDRLRALPLEAFIDAQVRLSEAQMAAGTGGIVGGGASFGPVVDGEWIPAHPRDAAAAGELAAVPLLIGTNLDENRLFGAMLPANASLTREATIERIAATFTDGDPGRATSLFEAYLAAREGRGERCAPSDVWFAIQTERSFRHHSMLVAEGHARQQPTYAYLFTFASPIYEGALGSCHALEVPLLFGTNTGPLEALSGTGEDVARLIAAMQDAWIAFARTGDPNHGGLPVWPRFSAERRDTMMLGTQQDVAYGPLEVERQAMAEVFPATYQ